MNHFSKRLCLTTTVFSLLSNQSFSSERSFEEVDAHVPNKSQEKTCSVFADSYQTAHPNTTAAGICLISSHDSRPMVLLGNRTFDQGLCTLGGGADLADINLAKTASREVLEESIGSYGITPLELHRSFSHMAETNQGLFYRMYFSFVVFIDVQILNNALQAAKGCSREYTSFYWIPVSDLLNHSGSAIKIENKNLSLFGPFQKMLQEKPVRNLLEYVRDNGKLPQFPLVLKNGRESLHTADRNLGSITEVEKQRKSETQLFQSIALKAQTNLLIKQYGSLLEKGVSTKGFRLLKDDLSLKEEFLQSLRKNSSTDPKPLKDPVEASLSLTIAKQELGDAWEPIGTTDILDEQALRRNISKFLTKNQTWEWEPKDENRPILFQKDLSEKLLDVLIVHIKREIANPNYLPLYHGTQKSFEDFFYTMARLREILYMTPTSSHAGLRATDAYFGPNFPRTTEGFINWLESGNQLSANSQYFCGSLGIWGCKFGHCLGVLTGGSIYSHQDFHSIFQAGFALLGAPADSSLLIAPMKQHPLSSLGGLVQILVPPTASLGYTSDGGLKKKPISLGVEGQQDFSPYAMAQKIRLGLTSFRNSYEIRFAPASWNTHNPEVFSAAHRCQRLSKISRYHRL